MSEHARELRERPDRVQNEFGLDSDDFDFICACISFFFFFLAAIREKPPDFI